MIRHTIACIKKISLSILILLYAGIYSGYRLGPGNLRRYYKTRVYFLLQQFVKNHRSLFRLQETSRSSGNTPFLSPCAVTMLTRSAPLCFNQGLAKIRLDEAALDPFRLIQFDILPNHGRNPITGVETGVDMRCKGCDAFEEIQPNGRISLVWR